MPLVVDASRLLPSIFRDEPGERAFAPLDCIRLEGPTYVPAVWPLELLNAVLSVARRRQLDRDVLAGGLQGLLGLSVEIVPIDAATTAGPVQRLARAHGLTAYDASYLWLAVEKSAALASDDSHLNRAAEREGIPLV